MTDRTRREKSTLSTLPSASGLIATSHAAGENIIRIMPGAFIQRRHLANRLCDFSTAGHNSIKWQNGLEMT